MQKKPSAALWVSIFFLGIALMVIAMVLISNSSYHAGVRMAVDEVRYQKEICLEVNDTLQRYERARDCSAYGTILDNIEDRQRNQ